MLKLTPYTATMGLEGTRLNLAVAAIATCAFWLFGYDMSIMVGNHKFVEQHSADDLAGRLDHGGVLHICLSRDE